MSAAGADFAAADDPIDAWLAEHGGDLIAWRRQIHAHPELSRQEVRTTELVMSELTAAGLTPRRLPLGRGQRGTLAPRGHRPRPRPPRPPGQPQRLPLPGRPQPGAAGRSAAARAAGGAGRAAAAGPARPTRGLTAGALRRSGRGSG